MTTPTQDLLAKRVEAGCMLLDEHYPGWENLIDLKRLKMNTLEDCILGQLFGDYTTGRSALQLQHGTGPHFGLDLVGGPTTNHYFEILDELWIDTIQERRS